MSHGVRLVSLSVQDVGVLAGRVDLGPFSKGVNVISGRNEAGKSTLVEALRAALFERHDAKHQRIKALQTHGTRNAPEVWVELDVGGERVSVHKRFLEKPLVEVRLPGGGPAYHGAEADELLLARLDGRPANRRGATRNDMGLWGLLWVTQDDSAHADPGDTLDENVRGALSDAVSRQVGQMMGGKHGERVRTLVLDHAGRYFTRKNNLKTGEYKLAEDKHAAADERVQKIDRALREVEELAEQHTTLMERLREAERELPDLERERDLAIAEWDRVEKLAGVVCEAETRLAAAEATLEAAQKDADARASLQLDADALDGEIRTIDTRGAELAPTLDDLKKAATGAREQAGRAKRAMTAARAALEDADEQVDRARRSEEACRVGAKLSEAENIGRELAAAMERLSKEALHHLAYEQLESLASKATQLRKRLDAEGTRIVVYRPTDEPIVRSVGTVSTIEVPMLGALEVEPAGPGLAQAVGDGERRRAMLEEALRSLGVADVQAARARRAVRSEAESEAEALAGRNDELAPSGLAALEQNAGTPRVELARLEAAFGEAARAQQERDNCVRGLAAIRIDEDALDALRQKEQRVAVLRAACDAVGTQVELVALRDLRFQTAHTFEALASGESAALTLTRATTVVLDGIAELKFEPRGEDLAKSRAKLERAERELTTSLQALGVASMAEATEAARAWARLDTQRKRAEARLHEVAPQGLETLRADVEKARARSRAVEESLAEARTVSARHEELTVELSKNRVTMEALARVEELERDVRESEAAVQKLTARVRAISGPVANGPEHAWAVFTRLRPAAVGNVDWEIIPGEIGDGFDVEGLERRLREALDHAGVVDLDAAKARFRTGLTLDAQIAELRKQLRNLAPDGVDALRARIATLTSGAEPSEGQAAQDLAELQAIVDARRTRLRAAEQSAEDTDTVADLAERQLSMQESAFAESMVVRREKVARRDVVAAKLAALREVEPDGSLAERHATAITNRDAAREAAKRSAADLEAATPQLLRDEVLRAEGAIASWKKATGVLRDEMLRTKTLLDKAAVEGRFEDLGEAKAELTEATETLARLEREANTARVLASVVEDAYAESQRLFLAPVLKEAAPYLAKLRPGTELRMTRDLKLDKVVRRGAEEEFGQLSGGTREQLSVIVRLALARVLARDSRPLPLILDDTMGWTDDGRFLSMVQILRDASSELQVVLLTCHPSRFDRFQAEYSVDLDRVKAGQPSA